MIKETPTKDIVKIIKIAELKDSPFQGRLLSISEKETPEKDLKRLEELTESIRQSGLMQPIIVRPVAGGYEIIDGHRRVMATRKLGQGQIKAIIKDCDDREAQILSVIGNLQRQELSNIEMALTFSKLLDTGIFKDKRELSKAIGKDETYVGDLLNTLNMDSRIVEDLMKRSSIKDLRILRAIRRADRVDETGKSDTQWQLYQKVLKKKLGREELQKMLRKSPGHSPLKTWTIKTTARNITFRIETRKLTEEQKANLIQMLEESILELSGKI